MANVTPWTRYCIENRLDAAGEQSLQVSEVLIAHNGGLSWSKVVGISVSTIGLRLATSGASGYSEEVYAWDELENWSHSPPSWHTWTWSIECNRFKIFEMSDVECGALYNTFVNMSCIAFYAISRRFPLMRSGVFLGYLDPDPRSMFDASGFPRREYGDAILRQLP